MAKFYGSVGYADTVETAPGVYEEKIVEYPYYGDLTRNTRQLQSGETLNDDINIANEISIVADPFARKNFHKMRYVAYMGAKWKISKVEVGYPRLILTIGSAEIGMSRSVNDIDLCIFINNCSVFGKNGNSTFTFDIVGIHYSFGYFLIFTENTALF